MPLRSRACTPHRAYTLVEVLVIVAILGILGAMIIPSMGQAGVLRAQSAIRTIVTDITFAQSDAMAFQRGRAVMFDLENNRYSIVQVTGPELDEVNDVMLDVSRPNGEMRVDLSDSRFWGATIASADFDGQPYLIFDEMGAPVTTPGGNTPSSGGMIVIETPEESYWIAIDGFTGHVTTGRVENGGEEE